MSTNTLDSGGKSTRRPGYVYGGVGYIPLTRGRAALCDPGDVAFLSQWDWFVVISKKSNDERAFRNRRASEDNGRAGLVQMSHAIARPEIGQQVDHVNHNPLDNRRSNLRVCSQAENKRNVRSKGGTSRFKGVTWNARRRKWSTSITKGRSYWIGYYDSETDAAIVYNVAAQLFHGDFACLNDI